MQTKNDIINMVNNNIENIFSMKITKNEEKFGWNICINNNNTFVLDSIFDAVITEVHQMVQYISREFIDKNWTNIVFVFIYTWLKFYNFPKEINEKNFNLEHLISVTF